MNCVSICDLKSLPKHSGIYKVVGINEEVIYVGQAKNIYKRWNNGHHKLPEILAECGEKASIVTVKVPEWLLNRSENAAIEFYRPKLNQKQASLV